MFSEKGEVANLTRTHILKPFCRIKWWEAFNCSDRVREWTDL